MALSSDLVSQFVKVTNDTEKPKPEASMYGTVIEHEGKQYVKLDGSDLLTPVVTTTDMSPGERVYVTLKNHSALVTGNISSPSAKKDDVDSLGGRVEDISDQITEFEIVVADKVSTEEFDTEKGRIDSLWSDNVAVKEKLTATDATIAELEANTVTINESLTATRAQIEELDATKLDAEIADITYATIEGLEATDAKIYSLESTYGEFVDLTTEKLEAHTASISNLETNKLSTEDAKITYANIDFSNIEEAAIEKVFSESGIIKDLIVSEGKITGELVGVTIKGDLIEGETIKADKLVVKGSDGLYYKLNFEAGTFSEGEAIPTDGLHGSVIVAESITAEKIQVDDLVAFGATIGGFKIDTHALYSGVKSSMDNTTRGMYFGDDGQLNIGDADNFIKFYEDENGDYKLAITADKLVLGSSKTSVEEVVSNAQVAVDKVEDLEQRLESGDLKGEDGKSVPMIRTIYDNVYTMIQLIEYGTQGRQTNWGLNADDAAKYTLNVGDLVYLPIIAQDDQSTVVIITEVLVVESATIIYGSSIGYICSGSDGEDFDPDALKIGGRNLLLDSATEQTIAGGTGWRKAQYNLSNYGAMVKGETYTLTVDLTPGDGLTSFQINNSEGSIFTSPYNITVNGTDRQTATITFDATKNEINHIRLYALPNDGTQTGTTTIHAIQLEKGNAATDWTPAPEDTDEKIGDVQTAVDTVDTVLSEQVAEILQQAESIIQRVELVETDSSTNSVSISELKQTIKDFNISFSNIRETIDAVDSDMKNRFEDYETYFRFSADGMYMGEQGSPLQIRQKGGNDAVIEFLLNGIAVLTIDKNGMVAETNTIYRVFHIGTFTFTAVSDTLLTIN